MHNSHHKARRVFLPSYRKPHREGEKTSSTTDRLSPVSWALRSPSPALLEVLNRVSNKASYLHHGSDTPIMNSRGIAPRSLSANDTYSDGPHGGPSRLCRSQLDLPIDQYKLEMKRISQSVDGIESMEIPEQDKTIHLYTLKLSVSLYVLVRSIWLAYLLDNDSSEPSGKVSELVSIREEPSTVSLESLLEELATESVLQEKVQLLAQLRSAILKHSEIRRGFFKDQVALNAIIGILQRLEKTHCSWEDEEDAIQWKENQLELTSAALATINSVLSRSHGCHLKNKVMQWTSVNRRILETVVQPPRVSCPYDSIWLRFLSDFSQLSSHEWHILPQKQLLLLHQEVIRGGIVTVYFVLQHLEEQITVHSSGNQELLKRPLLDNKITLLFKGIALRPWLKYVVTQMLYLVDTASRNRECGKGEAALLFQSLSVFTKLLQSVDEVRHICETDFTEEFRYYLTKGLVAQCFKNHNELKDAAMNVLSTMHEYLSSP